MFRSAPKPAPAPPAPPAPPRTPPREAEAPVVDPAEVQRQEDRNRIKRDLHQQVIKALDLSSIGMMDEERLRNEVHRLTERLCRKHTDDFSVGDRETLYHEVLDEVFGLGPLEPLMRDPLVTDILVNGPKTVYVERNGCLELSKVKFVDDDHILAVVQRIAGRVGRRVDETTPMVDARTEDGSRLNAVIRPLALDGPLVSIRRFGTRRLHADDLLHNRTLAEEMLNFLAAAIEAKMNILVSGGTGSGKTTLLNVLSSFIPHEERVVTIEDAAELALQQPHVARMETRTANVEGKGEVNTRDLVRNALRMRPDRIIVGECRGSEALDMLQAMNTGHEGSMTTVHANTTRDAAARLEMMVGMAGFEVPIWTIRRQIASAIHLVVQVARLVGGARKIVRVSEITGMEGDTLCMHDIFEFRQLGLDSHRQAVGDFYATGIRPHCYERILNAGVYVSPELFELQKLSTVDPGGARDPHHR